MNDGRENSIRLNYKWLKYNERTIVQVNQIVPILALLSLLSGCSDRLYWLEITPEKQVLDGYDEDQGIREHVAKLAKGPIVEGSGCSWYVMSTSIAEKTRRDAYADAIGKAGAPYDVLIDVVQTSTSYPPLPLYCVSLKGMAVKNETYYATNGRRANVKPNGKVN